MAEHTLNGIGEHSIGHFQSDMDVRMEEDSPEGLQLPDAENAPKKLEKQLAHAFC